MIIMLAQNIQHVAFKIQIINYRIIVSKNSTNRSKCYVYLLLHL